MEYLSFGIRLWLAMVCAVAVLGKVRSRRSFGTFVTSLESAARAVPLVRAPARFARRLAPPVLAAEIAVAVLSPLPATAVLGCVLAVGLFGMFTAGVGVAVATGADASCACFGRITTKLGWPHVARNTVLVAAASVALILGLAGGIGPAGGVSAGIPAAVATLVVVFWSDIAAVLTPGLSEVEVSK